jgi:hypothetical protein
MRGDFLADLDLYFLNLVFKSGIRFLPSGR